MRSNTFNYARLTAAFFAFLYFSYCVSTAGDWHFIDGVDLIIHEAGHTVLFFLGDFVRISAGSLFQVLIPVVFIGYFFRQKQYFSASFLFFWLGQNLANISVYARDAVLMQLPLLGGDGVIHDWNYLLSHLNLLGAADSIANAIFWLGVCFIAAGAFLCFYFSAEREA